MEIPIKRLGNMPRWRDAENKARDTSRTNMNIHPDTLRRLRTFLETAGRATGVGYSEFIDLSLDIWEQVEMEHILGNAVEDIRIEALLDEQLGPFDPVIGGRVKRDRSEQIKAAFASLDKARAELAAADTPEANDTLGRIFDAIESVLTCDDCHRTDGTHDMEVEH